MFDNLLTNFIELGEQKINFLTQCGKKSYYAVTKNYNSASNSQFYIFKTIRGISASKWSIIDLEIALYLLKNTHYPIFEVQRNKSYKQIYPPVI